MPYGQLLAILALIEVDTIHLNNLETYTIRNGTLIWIIISSTSSGYRVNVFLYQISPQVRLLHMKVETIIILCVFGESHRAEDLYFVIS